MRELTEQRTQDGYLVAQGSTAKLDAHGFCDDDTCACRRYDWKPRWHDRARWHGAQPTFPMFGSAPC